MTEKEVLKKKTTNTNLEEMAQAGVHFGHKTSRVHPKMKPYIQGAKNKIHIIDLKKTEEKLNEALKFIEDIIKEGQTLLLVGTKIQTKNLVKEIAQKCGFFYVNDRWLGGTITNFRTISKRIEYFKELEQKEKEGGFKKYTKKEKAKIEKKLKGLRIKFEGLKEMTRIPNVLFVLDMEKDAIAIREAKKKGLKIMAIADTSTDPDLVDYPIPANDDALSSVRYILEKVVETTKKPQKKTKKK